MPAQVVQFRRRRPPATGTGGSRDASGAATAPLVDYTEPRPRALVRPLPLLARWYSVDDWGRDARLLQVLGPLARLRWNVSVGGAQHIPATGGALLVANARRLSLSR